MKNNHGLRTTGRPTGNFGRNKVKGKPGELDLTKEILNRENLKVPDRIEAFTRLEQAYNQTSDPKLKATLRDMLRSRYATLRQPEVKPMQKPSAPHWENIKNVR